jgi:hypothetical protein
MQDYQKLFTFSGSCIRSFCKIFLLTYKNERNYHMQAKVILTIVAFFLLSPVASSYAMRKSNSSYAEFNKNGYKVEVSWQQKRDVLKAWGVVDEGKECNQLNLSIFFRNSKDSSIGHIETALSKYDPHFSRKYKASDQVYTDRKYRKNWHVSSIYVECLK